MRIVCALFFLLMFQCSFGQTEWYEQMLHKPYKDIANDIEVVSVQLHQIPDTTEAFAFINQFKSWAEENNDPQLVLEAEMLHAFYMKNVYPGQKDIDPYIALAEYAKEENTPIIEARAVLGVAAYYWDVAEYQKAFKWMMRDAQILKSIDEDDFPLMARYLNTIGRAYYFFQDYENALTYFEKASILKIDSFNSLSVIEAQNNVGLCYQKAGKYELSDQWFRKILYDTSQYQSPIWKGIASGNLGYNYYLQGDYDKAIPLFRSDIEFALIPRNGITDYGLAAGSTIPLADIYLKTNQLDKSKREIDSARAYIRLSGQTDRLRKLYPVISKWFARNNQIDSSEAYFDLAKAADVKYNEKFNSLKLLRADQEYQAKEKELELAQLKSEGQLKLAKRNLITAITVLLLIGTLLLFWFRNKYLVKKQQIKDLALVNTREALENAKSQLENMVRRVNQNNEMIIQLQKGKLEKKNIEFLEKLKSTSILTQDDWTKYQEIFKKAYPRFLFQLGSVHPDLSPAERRVLCLEKLKLSNNEMALVLGVSANTVMVTKHRIRKKVNLESQKELTEYIKALN